MTRLELHDVAGVEMSCSVHLSISVRICLTGARSHFTKIFRCDHERRSHAPDKALKAHSDDLSDAEVGIAQSSLPSNCNSMNASSLSSIDLTDRNLCHKGSRSTNLRTG